MEACFLDFFLYVVVIKLNLYCFFHVFIKTIVKDQYAIV